MKLSKDIIVQGKTLEQWEIEGKLNSMGRIPHVHPEPEDTEEAIEAFFLSLTAEEKLSIVIDGILNQIGDVSLN